MALGITAPITRTITAGTRDPAGTLVPDPNSPTLELTSSDPGLLTVDTPVEVASGVFSTVYTPVANGTATVTATAKDPDGNTVVGTEDVGVTVVITPPPSTDATEIDFS